MACELLVAAYGIQFPDQGLNFEPPALGAWSLSHWTTREASVFILIAVIHVTILKCTIHWNLVHSRCCTATTGVYFSFVVSSLSLSQPVRLFVTPWTVFTRFLCPWDFLGKNTGEGCHFLFQWIFPAQELKLCLLHWQVDSFPLSHQESPCQSQEQTPNCAA